MKYFVSTPMAGSWVAEYESPEAALEAGVVADCQYGNGSPVAAVCEVNEDSTMGAVILNPWGNAGDQKVKK